MHHFTTRSGVATYCLSGGSVFLTWIGSKLQSGCLVAAGAEFAEVTAELARLGAFLGGVAAFGMLLINLHDRLASLKAKRR